MIALYRNADLDEAFAEVGRHWDGILDAVKVKTPDRSMDIMLNGWLLYQTIACRLWARAAFYQASGAYGFRDQLQDGMALSAVRPQMTRAHILRAAARQFVEGDVQHWWLPHSGQGVRTRISDDRAWLAFTVGQYVEVSGDAAILDEKIPFLEGQVLEPSEHDSFFTPIVGEETATLFEHCARALDSGLARGGHGLPLIGAGDWNDGMNRVGARGAGESVWLGWLLYATLKGFALIADARGEQVRAENWRAHATALQASLEREAWDGEWYRRGFFDDGTPLGSSQSEECRIDCIAQSWAALSGAAPLERATRAMASVERELIRPQDGLAPCSLRRSTRRRSIPAISRAIRLASGKMAANIPTPRSGPSWPSPSSVRATRRRACSRCSIRSITPAHGRTSTGTRLSPMSSPQTSIPCRPMSDAAAGRGTLAPRPGCSAPGWKASWECGWKAIAFASIPAYPKRGLASNSFCGAVRHDMRFASKIRRESNEASPSPPWMAPKSQRNRRGFCLSMTEPRTGSSFDWDEGTAVILPAGAPGPSIRSRIGRRHCRMTSFPFSPQPG